MGHTPVCRPGPTSFLNDPKSCGSSSTRALVLLKRAGNSKLLAHFGTPARQSTLALGFDEFNGSKKIPPFFTYSSLRRKSLSKKMRCCSAWLGVSCNSFVVTLGWFVLD
jgi:hypothetical protein